MSATLTFDYDAPLSPAGTRTLELGPAGPKGDAGATGSAGAAGPNTVTASTTTTLTGVLVGDGSTVAARADVSPTAGTFTLATVTVDAFGRVTAASSGSASGGTWGSITGTLADQTDLAAALNARQPLDGDLTSWAGVTRASGFDTFAAVPSSANLAALLADETGTGAAVFGTSPTITDTLTVSQGNFINVGVRLAVGPAAYTAIEVRSAFASCLQVQVASNSIGHYGAGANSHLRWWSAVDMASGGSFDLAVGRNAVGVLEINSGTAGQYRDVILRNLSASAGTITLGAFTVATLPSAASNTGAAARVSDSNVAASGNYGATVAGGGANVVKVFSNGTNWVIA